MDLLNNRLILIFLITIFFGFSVFSQNIGDISDGNIIGIQIADTELNQVEGKPYIDSTFQDAIIVSIKKSKNPKEESLFARYNAHQEYMEIQLQEDDIRVLNAGLGFQVFFQNKNELYLPVSYPDKDGYGLVIAEVPNKVMLIKRHLIDIIPATQTVGYKEGKPARYGQGKETLYILKMDESEEERVHKVEEIPSNKSSIFEEIFDKDFEKVAKDKVLYEIVLILNFTKSKEYHFF